MQHGNKDGIGLHPDQLIVFRRTNLNNNALVIAVLIAADADVAVPLDILSRFYADSGATAFFDNDLSGYQGQTVHQIREEIPHFTGFFMHSGKADGPHVVLSFQ